VPLESFVKPSQPSWQHWFGLTAGMDPNWQHWLGLTEY